MRKAVFLAIISMGFALKGNLDRIRRAYEKLEYEKTMELIMKMYEKEPENPGVLYFSALLHNTDSFPGYDLDTARLLVNEAYRKILNSSEELVNDLAEDDVTKSEIQALSDDIRDEIYRRVLLSLSVGEAEQFMELYPGSPYTQELIYKRDSIVFKGVRNKDTEQAYLDFLANFNTEEFRSFSTRRIDELRYANLEENGNLRDYFEFAEKYPETRFRKPIEQYVFRLSTVDHLPGSYERFMDFAQDDDLRRRAGDILYSLDPSAAMKRHPESDSLERLGYLENLYLIPAIESGKFGFESSTGESQIDYRFDDVKYDYKCGLTADDWLLVSQGEQNLIINKRGDLILESVSDFKDLGSGAALVNVDSASYLYLKSAIRILDFPIEDAGVLEGRWIKVKKDGRWALVSFSGHHISDYLFDDIRLEGSFWVFERDGLIALYTESRIEEDLREGGLDLEYKFDDIELVTDRVLIGFRDDRECMLNDQLQFLIPWGVYEINPDESGWYLRTAGGYRLYNRSQQDIMNQVHPYLETNHGWLAVKTNEDWMLLSRKGLNPSRGYDSVKLVNDHCAFVQQQDSSKLIFSNGFERKLDDEVVRSFYDQKEYLLLEDDTERSIIDSTGVSIVSGEFEELTFFSDTLFSVKSRGKVGLIKMDGTYLVEPVFDALDEREGLILTLRKGQIGCLDLVEDRVISASYETRISRIGENYLVRKDGKFGVIDSLENNVISFSYDEVKFWNDTSFVVREDAIWSFLNYSEEKLEEPVESLTLMTQSGDVSFWRYVNDGKYGLLSTRDGFLLQPEYTDIVNIGSRTRPIFFADQHLGKAGFHVVSYIGFDGELLFSKAYTKKDFDKILCDD